MISLIMIGVIILAVEFWINGVKFPKRGKVSKKTRKKWDEQLKDYKNES